MFVARMLFSFLLTFSLLVQHYTKLQMHVRFYRPWLLPSAALILSSSTPVLSYSLNGFDAATCCVLAEFCHVPPLLCRVRFRPLAVEGSIFSVPSL